LLLGLVTFGAIAYLPSIYYSFTLKFYSIAFLDTLALGFALFLLMGQRLSFLNKTLGLLLIFYALGLGLLIVLGPKGAGFLWLLMFSIMTGVLLGGKPAVISLGINLITLLGLSLLVPGRTMPWMETQPYAVAIWIVVGVNFICLNAVATISVAFLFNKISQMVGKEKQRRLQLENEIQNRIQAEETSKELLRQLHHSQKMEAIGTLAGGVAHDFNNILSTILGYAELSLSHLEKPHPAHENLEHICLASERGSGIVNQILAFSRQTPMDKTICDLGSILRECITFFRIRIPATIELATIIQSDRLLVFADKTQIYQAVMNLLTNSMHAIELDLGKEKGRISLGVGRVSMEQDAHGFGFPVTGDYFKLTVEDTGCGIADQDIPRLFEPYFTTKQIGKGTGMGLSIVHGIIQDHGGKIMVSSVVGKGSCFTVYLPCCLGSQAL
ncbi:MAG: hypothetical protein KKC20_18445, partial [Proteobacteria bacterium]|nr:hypothetical protein [Pseudomonadota bacterium]